MDVVASRQKVAHAKINKITDSQLFRDQFIFRNSRGPVHRFARNLVFAGLGRIRLQEISASIKSIRLLVM